ncbi:nitrilase and fragile histidine triad fusion protein NitFhit [Cephus cinctus]|uniref:Nitrilase and fragile histidine triad fusion protein NitFhit n=1 Tax=Cephus cinctus TaxID=211228 RepID=A0AAJ7FUC4_CEPCN|nr:nitrilase and fragile histidine triad fusion protein NitFhit [Cephus cinctus]
MMIRVQVAIHSLQYFKHYSVQGTRTIVSMSNPLAAICQMTSTSDKNKNLETICSLVNEAKQRHASIAFFPEACDYLADNKSSIVEMAEPLDGSTVTAYKKLACDNDMWLSFGGVHEKLGNDAERISNSHILINNKGDITQVYRKIHLFDMENKETGVRLMESDYVQQGSEILPPVTTPIGKLGLSICYDIRFPEISLALRNMGSQILTYPSAFTYQTGAAHWEVLLRARAIETQCYVIAAAQTGAHNKKRVSWGHAMIIDPWGAVIAQCAEKTGIAVAEIDLEILNKIRKNMPCDEHRRTDLYPVIQPLK